MKKIISTILAVAMVATISSSVLANPMNETFVTYSVPESYYVTIPEMITVDQFSDTDVVITATTNLEQNHMLTVNAFTMGPMGEIILDNGNSNWVETYLYYNDIDFGYERRIEMFEPVAQFTGQNFEARDLNRALKIRAIDPTGKAAGTYTGIIDFDIFVSEINI